MSQEMHPREAIGALVLGALDAEEAADVRLHLGGCRVCRAEHDRLSRLPDLLAVVPEEAWTSPPRPSELGLQRLLSRMRAERRTTRRRLVGGAVAAGVAAAAAVSVGVLIGTLGAGDAGSPQAGGVQTTARPWQLNGHNAALDVSGEITVVPVRWGSQLNVTLDGVKPGQRCRLVVVDDRGRRWDGGSWTVSYRDHFYWSGGVAVADDRIARVNVVTAGGRRLLSLT